MLIGATGAFAREREKLAIAPVEKDALGGEGVVAAVRPWGVPGLDGEQRTASDPATGSWLALSGHVWRDLASGRDGPAASAASSLLSRLCAKGLAALAETLRDK